MHLYEHNTCSFVVKVWVEPNDDPAGTAVWRGHITHVFSGERRYFADLAALSDFMRPYLRLMGVTIPEIKLE